MYSNLISTACTQLPHSQEGCCLNTADTVSISLLPEGIVTLCTTATLWGEEGGGRETGRNYSIVFKLGASADGTTTMPLGPSTESFCQQLKPLLHSHSSLGGDWSKWQLTPLHLAMQHTHRPDFWPCMSAYSAFWLCTTLVQCSEFYFGFSF